MQFDKGGGDIHTISQFLMLNICHSTELLVRLGLMLINTVLQHILMSSFIYIWTWIVVPVTRKLRSCETSVLRFKTRFTFLKKTTKKQINHFLHLSDTATVTPWVWPHLSWKIFSGLADFSSWPFQSSSCYPVWQHCCQDPLPSPPLPVCTLYLTDYS